MENLEQKTEKERKHLGMTDVIRCTIQPGYTWLDAERATNGTAFGPKDDGVIKTMAYSVVCLSEVTKAFVWGRATYEGIKDYLL